MTPDELFDRIMKAAKLGRDDRDASWREAIAEALEWRETVRDIYDNLMLGKSDSSGSADLRWKVIALIEQRHPDFFCVGKTGETNPPDQKDLS